MCHLMPQRHLPEWREEKPGFVHSGSSGVNHAITSESPTELSKVSSVTLYVNAVNTVWYSVVEAFIWYPTATVYKCLLLPFATLTNAAAA